MKEINFLFLTAHDFRTPRKASMHFIAQELAKRGQVRFFSLRYSWLSKKRPDGRHVIADRANKVENFNGVDCYLWKNLVHPFNTKRSCLQVFENLFYRAYEHMAPGILKQWIREADVLIFESGTAPVFFDLAKRLNPQAKTIYTASDGLEAINVAQYVKDTVRRISTLIDYSRLPSKLITADFASGAKLYYIPHGIDYSIEEYADPSPYGPDLHAVSIGSMLFDSEFFDAAGSLFPYVTFHVIGCGRQRPGSWPSNVIHYNEMRFKDTIPYIKHAAFGLAPYLTDNIPSYLADTSLKLVQYAFFGVPAVCPYEVVGDHAHRFGYKPGDKQSIATAIKAALEAGRGPEIKGLNWKQVADRILDPEAYPDTSMEGWDREKV
jgi:2-beta-glucuronyltransferase